MLHGLFIRLHLSHLEKSVAIYQNTLRDIPDDALTTYRDSGNGWTVLEVMAHMRDFETVFYERARLTVNEDNPPLPFPDPDTLATEKNYNAQNPADVIAEWVKLRNDHHAFLSQRTEADWERVAQHPTRGAFTLNDQILLTAWHDTNHIEQILRILTEKQA